MVLLRKEKKTAQARVNPEWKRGMKTKILLTSRENQPFEAVVLIQNLASQWLIAALAREGLIPKVENLGAGVKRIGVKGVCCPTCGKGGEKG